MYRKTSAGTSIICFSIPLIYSFFSCVSPVCYKLLVLFFSFTGLAPCNLALGHLKNNFFAYQFWNKEEVMMQMSCPEKCCLRDLQQRTDADAMPRENYARMLLSGCQPLSTISVYKSLEIAND